MSGLYVNSKDPSGSILDVFERQLKISGEPINVGRRKHSCLKNIRQLHKTEMGLPKLFPASTKAEETEPLEKRISGNHTTSLYKSMVSLAVQLI